MISPTRSPVHTPNQSLTRLRSSIDDDSSSSSSSSDSSSSSSSSSYKTASIGESTIRRSANESSRSDNEDVRMESSSSESSSSSSSSEEEANATWSDPNEKYKLLVDKFIDAAAEAAKPGLTKSAQKGSEYSTQQGVAQIPNPIVQAGCAIVGTSAQMSAEPVIGITVDSSAGISKAGAHASIDKGSVAIAKIKKVFIAWCSRQSDRS